MNNMIHTLTLAWARSIPSPGRLLRSFTPPLPGPHSPGGHIRFPGSQVRPRPVQQPLPLSLSAQPMPRPEQIHNAASAVTVGREFVHIQEPVVWPSSAALHTRVLVIRAAYPYIRNEQHDPYRGLGLGRADELAGAVALKLDASIYVIN